MLPIEEKIYKEVHAYAAKVKRCRDEQKKYFKTRSKEIILLKTLEKDLDHDTEVFLEAFQTDTQ